MAQAIETLFKAKATAGVVIALEEKLVIELPISDLYDHNNANCVGNNRLYIRLVHCGGEACCSIWVFRFNKKTKKFDKVILFESERKFISNSSEVVDAYWTTLLHDIYIRMQSSEVRNLLGNDALQKYALDELDNVLKFSRIEGCDCW